MSIIEYAPDSHAAEDYRSLAKELLGLENLICCDAEAAAAAAVGEAMKIGDKLRQAVRGSGGEDREWKNRLTEAQSRLLSEEMPQSKRAGAAASPAAQASPATEAAPVAEASSGTDALLVTDAAPGETVATATHVEESAPVIDFPAVAGVDAAPASETPSEASEPIAETNIADDRTNTSASTDLSDPFDQFVRFQDQHQPEPQTMAEVAPQGAAEDSATASVDANQTPVSAEPEAAQSAPEVIPVLDNPPSAAQSDSQNLPSWDTWLTQDANPLQAPEAAPEPETVPESPRIAAEVNVPEVTAGPEAAAQDVRLEDILPSLRTVKTDGPPPLPRADQPSQDVGIESSDDWSKPPAEEPHETPDCPNLRKYVQQVEFNEEQAAEDKPQAKRGIFSRLLGSKK